MQITFADSLPSDAVLIASIANKDSLPDGIESALAEGAKRSRFKGSAGQVVDGFVERDGKVLRVALAGAGDPKAKDRRANLEKAGGALAAKFLTSGESTIALDLTGADLSAEDAAAVLLGLRLRAWRWDEYRTTQKDAEKVSLESAVIVGAPDGIEAAWQRESALAEGVEFTKELVTLPANVLYPESFVERCRKALEGTGIEIIVLDDAQMEKLGMGALLGVAQGSANAPRMVVMRWNGLARARDRSPRDLTEIGASLAVFLRKHCDEAARGPAWNAFRRAQRARLLAWMQRGPLGAGDVARLLLGLRRGWKDGQGRALSAPAPLPEPSGPFLDFPARPGAAHLALSGRSWQRAILQKQARSAVAAGQIVTVFRFSPTALYHRMRFHPDGFWEQTGGQFGRSDRAQPLVQARTLAGRVAQEKALFAELRRF